MVLARVRIEADDYDWFDGEVEFPVLPPAGSTIEIMDRNANIRELTVQRLVIEGVMPAAKAELPNMLEKQTITIIASEF